MQQAIHTPTGNPVYVLTTKGGWSTIRDVDGHEVKTRNSALQFVETRAEPVYDDDADLQPAAPESKAKYSGPMLALRAAAKNYHRGSNGNPHCGDVLASALSGLDREQVVEVLIYALQLEGNPYAHLNAGQQSMNLRNRARQAMKKGSLQTADIELAVHEITGLGITI
jgi:hypothetical protein